MLGIRAPGKPNREMARDFLPSGMRVTSRTDHRQPPHRRQNMISTRSCPVAGKGIGFGLGRNRWRWTHDQPDGRWTPYTNISLTAAVSDCSPSSMTLTAKDGTSRPTVIAAARVIRPLDAIIEGRGRPTIRCDNARRPAAVAAQQAQNCRVHNRSRTLTSSATTAPHVMTFWPTAVRLDRRGAGIALLGYGHTATSARTWSTAASPDVTIGLGCLTQILDSFKWGD